MSNGLGEEAFRSLVDDSLLNLETGKNEHDWYSFFLSPPHILCHGRSRFKVISSDIRSCLRLLAQQDGDEQDLAAKPADASSGDGCISLISEVCLHFNLLEHLVKSWIFVKCDISI